MFAKKKLKLIANIAYCFFICIQQILKKKTVQKNTDYIVFF